MIKIESKDGLGAVVEANGSTKDLAAETLAIISGIYNQLKNSAPPIAAQMYRMAIMRATEEGGVAWEEHPGMTGITMNEGVWGKYGGK